MSCMLTKKAVPFSHLPRTPLVSTELNREKFLFHLIEWLHWRHIGRKSTPHSSNTWSFKYEWTSRAAQSNWGIASMNYRCSKFVGAESLIIFQVNHRSIGTSKRRGFRQSLRIIFRRGRRHRFASAGWSIHQLFWNQGRQDFEWRPFEPSNWPNRYSSFPTLDITGYG